jgi:hypothetical protein
MSQEGEYSSNKTKTGISRGFSRRKFIFIVKKLVNIALIFVKIEYGFSFAPFPTQETLHAATRTYQ